MKRSILLAVAVIIFLAASPALAQEYVLQGPWKLNLEDSQEFSKVDWNDAGWETLNELAWSDSRNTTANRTLWIRKKMVIPSGLQSEFAKTGLLSLSMGKILQSDDTYLNGKKIGSTGSGDTYRNYPITKDDIFWDKENTIAIRVSHWGQFRISVVPKFTAAAPEHFLRYNSTVANGDAKAPVLNKDLLYQFTITNASPKTAEGLVTADFYNFEGSKIYSAKKEVAIGTGKNTIDFSYKSTAPFLKIVYHLSIPVLNYKRDWNSEAGYENVIYRRVEPAIAYTAAQKFFSPDLQTQAIEGWLGEKLKANSEQRLKKVDENALLAGFINRPGSHSWIGEHVGKFLEAACNSYANNQDPQLKIQIDRTAQQLIAAQLPDGYLGTYDKDSHWTSWDVWSHRYDITGLLRYYEISGFKPALGTCENIGNLLMKTFGTMQGQRNIVKAGGHVGMAATCILESMAELYRFTGKKAYLDFCYYIIKSFDTPGGPRIISTLDSIGRVDKVANAKAYEMLSNLLGVVKLYRITADEKFLRPVKAAWNDVASKRLYITGTTSSFEHFQDDDVLPGERSANMGEGCVTTTWVQLSYQLLCITGEMKYVDELERSVYNHLTGAENPQTGCVSYYTPLSGVKPFGCSITCCMSSVPRGIAMIPFFTNGTMDGAPAFLFYEPGTYATTVGKNIPVSFTTATDFPGDGNVTITVNNNSTTPYALGFRKPYWAKDLSIAVNGKRQITAGKELATVSRVWKKDDKVEITFTMPLIVLGGGRTYPGKLALQRGPQVLVFDEQLNGFASSEVIIDATEPAIDKSLPLLPEKWIGGMAFQIKAQKNKTEKNIILVPYADASQSGGAITTWLSAGN